MDSDGREVALSEELVEFGGTESALDEDDDLVEFQSVEEIVQLSVLLALVESDSELL